MPPESKAPAVHAAHKPHTPSWACGGGHRCASWLQGGVCSSAAPRCPPNPAVPFNPKLPSLLFPRRLGREGGTEPQREASPSVFNAPAAGAGQGGSLRVSLLRGAVGRAGMGCMWGQAGGLTGAVTPAEEAGPTQHLLLLPPGRTRSSLPSQAACD